MERVQTLLNLSPQFVLNLVCQFYPWKEKQLKQYEKYDCYDRVIKYLVFLNKIFL